MDSELLAPSPGDLIGYRKNGQPIYLIGGASEVDVQGDAEVSVETDASASTDDSNAEQTTEEVTAAPWAPQLESLPESVRPLVEPIFREWDANVTKRLQSVHSEYEPYKPFTEYQPDDLEYAISIAQALNNDPASFVKKVVEAYGIEGLNTPEQGAADQTEDEPDGDTSDLPPEIARKLTQHEELLRQMAQVLVSEREQAEEQQALQDFQAELAQARETLGDFHEETVLGYLAADDNLSVEDAVKKFHATLETYGVKPRVPAPKVVGNGGVPSTQQAPSKMGSKDTKTLIVHMLEEAAKAQQGN